MRKLRFLSLLCGACLLACSAGGTEAGSGDTGRTLGSVLDGLGLKAQLERVVPLLGLDMKDPVLPDKEGPFLIRESQPNLEPIRVDIHRVLTIDKERGQLRTYMFQGEEQIPEGLAPEARISQEKAVETALKVLRAANVPGDLSAATVTYGPGRGGTSLRGASWEIARSDTYQGIDCMSGLMMRISAYSGRVLAFHYTPPVIPESMEIRISKEDAIQRALDRCYNVAHMTGFVQSNIEPTLYIVTPGPKAGLQAKARLCWRVMLTTRTPPPKGEGTGNQSCSVDCVTGEVIAGLGAP